MTELKVLMLIVLANGMPVILRNLLGDRLGRPIDGGRRLRDGRPLFGPGKTWRGVAGAVVSTTLAAPLAGLSPGFGALSGLLAMTGDLLGSFLKRRIGVEPHGRAPGLDQVPESLLPALAAHWLLGLSWSGVLLVTALFTAGELLLSPLLYRLGIRQRPW
ncbi:MAG: CDP-archaeol synthase [Gammaproteobacteria bacterium]|nr:MAG: CDP-archaeol synthase [Gammaproteobacteria bacterium]